MFMEAGPDSDASIGNDLADVKAGEVGESLYVDVEFIL
jgi:hypothetical protein